MRKRHPGTIERRGSSLRVILYTDGTRHTFTLPTLDRREAVEFAEVKAAELARESKRRRVGLPGSVPVSLLLDQFAAECIPVHALATQVAYRRCLGAFRTFFVDRLGDPKVSEIRAGHVQDFLTWRRSCGATMVGPRTLILGRAVLHAVFDLAERLELREGNPVSKVRLETPDARPPVILTDEELERLLHACRERPMLSLYVTALAETGARCESEVLHWQWDDLDFEGGFVRIAMRDGHRTKGGKERWVPMTPQLRTALRLHLAQFRFATYKGVCSPWVFHHPGGAQAGDRIGRLRQSFQSAARRAGLPAGLHQHDLRHRRVTTWLAAGKNPVHVKEAVGHADLKTTMAYTHLSREHLRSLVAEPTVSRPTLVEQQQG
jgi:integrase